MLKGNKVYKSKIDGKEYGSKEEVLEYLMSKYVEEYEESSNKTDIAGGIKSGIKGVLKDEGLLEGVEIGVRVHEDKGLGGIKTEVRLKVLGEEIGDTVIIDRLQKGYYEYKVGYERYRDIGSYIEDRGEFYKGYIKIIKELKERGYKVRVCDGLKSYELNIKKGGTNLNKDIKVVKSSYKNKGYDDGYSEIKSLISKEGKKSIEGGLTIIYDGSGETKLYVEDIELLDYIKLNNAIRVKLDIEESDEEEFKSIEYI